MSKILLQTASPFYFENLVYEMMEYATSHDADLRIGGRYLGYIHEENPLDMGELYVVFQENPPDQTNSNLKGGVPLADLVKFISTLNETIQPANV